MPKATIGGFVAPGFDEVLRVFEENFSKRKEVGAAVAVFRGDEKVVDLWGGVRDKKAGTPWTGDTLSIIFSATKGLAASAFLVLVDRGAIDLDATVASYWPGFARANKQDITVRQLLNHVSGLSAIDMPLTMDDVQGWSSQSDPARVIEAMEAQEPLWEPGTAQGYNAISYGFFAGELFRRVTGDDVGAFLKREIAGPLGADVHLGLDATEEHRVSQLYTSGPKTFLRHILPRVIASRQVEGRVYRNFLRKNSATKRAFANPAAFSARGVKNYGTRQVRAMSLPFASGTASAEGLARFYAGIGNGVVRAETLLGPQRRQSWAWDRVLCKPMGFSQGFVKDELHLFSPNPHTFGHPGAGGPLGYHDPDANISFGYVMNRMDFRIRSPRAMELSKAVYRSL